MQIPQEVRCPNCGEWAVTFNDQVCSNCGAEIDDFEELETRQV